MGERVDSGGTTILALANLLFWPQSRIDRDAAVAIPRPLEYRVNTVSRPSMSQERATKRRAQATVSQTDGPSQM